MTEAGPERDDGAQEAERHRAEQERAERMKSLQGHRLTPRSPSDFQRHDLAALRAMTDHASPAAIETSGRHWRSSADRLGGDDGHGGIRKAFRTPSTTPRRTGRARRRRRSAGRPPRCWPSSTAATSTRATSNPP
ncbi:hypothetical protein O1L55_22065 [Streptomyces albulus]|nr:hypothetical protein [Streptomyces noursei]